MRLVMWDRVQSLGPRRVIVLLDQHQHLRLVPVDSRGIPFHLGFATEDVSKFERVVTGLALEVFSLLTDALVAIGRVFARTQQHQVAKAVEVNLSQLNAELLSLGMDMLHRVLRGDSVGRQLGRVIETETAALSPENVFQFLEQVMLEASAVGLLQVIDNCVDAPYGEVMTGQQRKAGFLLTVLRQGQLIVNALQQRHDLRLRLCLASHQRPEKRRQPILRTSLAGEVSHTLQLAQVAAFQAGAGKSPAVVGAASADAGLMQIPDLAVSLRQPFYDPQVELITHRPQAFDEGLGLSFGGVSDEVGKVVVEPTVMQAHLDIVLAVLLEIDAVGVH